MKDAFMDTTSTACLQNFKVLILDADGVWFDGKETRAVSKDGTVLISKTRDFRDGQGLSFLRALGIHVLFATGEGEPLGSIVSKLNELPSVVNGAWKPVGLLTGQNAKGAKVEGISRWLAEHEHTWSECVYVGDDVNDIEPAKKAALFVTPADAQRVAVRYSGLVLTKSGGAGAVRELAELVLDARGIDEAELPPA